MSLNMGGDDITEFLFVLLERIAFPYREVNLAHAYDWNILEDLKFRMCTLTEVCLRLHSLPIIVTVCYHRAMWP